MMNTCIPCTDIHHFTVSLYCALQILHLYKLKVCGNSALSKSMGSFVYFLSLCHMLAILVIFQTFSLLLYLLR